MPKNLKPCAEVSMVVSPVIEGGSFTLPFNEETYKMENIMVFNNESKGGLKPTGKAKVECIKKETYG